MNTTPESNQTQSTTTAAAGFSRLRRGAAALALGVIGGGISIGAFGAVTGVGMPAATAQQQETPAQRCARQTAEYNQTQAALWKAANPGQQLTGQPWPAFVCVDVPTPNVPAPAPGGNSGTDQGPSRTHTWDGFDDSQRQFGDDMALGGLSDPNRGLADRMNKTPTDTTGPSAGDSARSNVPLPTPWATNVPTTGGGNRSVNVVDTDQGQLIVDDAGRATGEVVRTDPTTGARTIERVADTAGRQVAQSAAQPSTSAKPSASVRPTTTTPVAPAPTQGNQDDDATVEPVAGFVPIVPLAAAGAAAGAAGVLGAGRRGRGLFGGDGAPRATVRYPWGDEQTLFLLESAASDHTQRFDLDIPPGGRAVKRADGGVDVLDADGRVVRRVDPPWAFDAAGRPVNTRYEIDPVTGELIQIVEPGPNALYPILADPNKNETMKNEVTGQEAIKTDDGDWLVPHKRQDGSGNTDWTLQDASGEHQQSVAGMDWDENGNPQNIKTIDNSQVDLPQQDRMDWANRTGTNQGDNIDNSLINNDDGTFSDPTQGTTVPGHYNEETDQRSFDQPDGTTITEHPIGDGNKNWTQENPGTNEQTAVSNLDWQDNGSPEDVGYIDNSETELPPQDGEDNRAWGNATQTQTPQDGVFQDENQNWHDGAREAEGYDTPAYRTEDGTIIGGRTNDDGNTDWTATNPNGERATIRDLDWDDQGNPVINDMDEFQPIDKGTAQDGMQDGAREDVESLATLVGLGPEGSPGVKDAWKSLGMGAYTAAGGQGKDAQREAWKQIGKDQVAWDDFARGDVDYATGRLAYNTAFAAAGLMEGGGLVKGADAASDAGRLGRGARDAGRVGRGADIASDGLSMRKHELPNAKKPDYQHLDSEQRALTVEDTAQNPPNKVETLPYKPINDPSFVPKGDDSGAWRGYPGHEKMVEETKTDHFFEPDGNAWGKINGVNRTRQEFMNTDMRLVPEGTKYPDFVDEEGGQWLANWNLQKKNDDLGYAKDPVTGKPLRNDVDLKPGETVDVPIGTLMDRFGFPDGATLGSPKDSYGKRSLHPFSAAKEYTIYQRTLKELPEGWKIITGTIGEDFGQPGRGTQFNILNIATGDKILPSKAVAEGILRVVFQGIPKK